MVTIENIQGMKVVIRHGDRNEVIDGAGIMANGTYILPREQFEKLAERRKEKLAEKYTQEQIGKYQ
jgi:hypothetical protein